MPMRVQRLAIHAHVVPVKSTSQEAASPKGPSRDVTTEEGSARLREGCYAIAAHLQVLNQALIHDAVYHVQHGHFARQARRFVEYVDSALRQVEHARFAQAFAHLRSAMEHWSVDAITMLGDRFVRHYGNISDEQLGDLRARWEAGELPSIIEEPTLVGPAGTKLRVVHRGLTNPDDGTVIHPLYFEADHFDPFFGTPDDQQEFAGWLNPDLARDHATEQRRRYNINFRWGAIVESLVLNELVAARQVVHLDVHHRYLSAFVHSQKSAHELLERAPIPPESVPNHSTIELTLLYSAQLLARYALTFIAMTERLPTVDLAEKEQLRERAEQLLAASRHLWFLEDAPQQFDRGEELLARVAEWMQTGQDGPPPDDGFDDEAIRYYRNPLDRLRRMHTAFNELATGFGYQPPW